MWYQLPIITVEIKLETAVFDPNVGLQFLEVLPNPFSENIFVKMNLLYGQDLEMTLFNIQGQQIEFFEEKLITGEHFLKYDLKRNLSSGAYVFNVRSGEFSYYFNVSFGYS